MISKTVLVYVPGWPLRWESFLPKARLARLAAREIALGREAAVYDWGTPASLECFAGDLAAHADQTLYANTNGYLGWFRTRNTRGRLMAVRGNWHRDLAAQIAESRAGKVVYLAETREDYREARSVAALVASMRSGTLQTVCGPHADGYMPHVAGGQSVFEGVEHATLPGPEAPMPVYDPAVYPSIYAGGKLHQFTVSGNAKRAVEEIIHCQRLVPARTFHVEDRGGLSASRNLASELLESRLDVWYSRRLRPGQGGEDVAPLLEASGCRCLDFFLMSGSQRLVEDFFGMTHGTSQARALLRACRASGIFASLELVYPCPWDDRHTRAETLLFTDQTLPDAVRMGFPELRYGGRWSEAPQDFGFQVTPDDMAGWARACDSPQFLPAPVPRPYRMGGVVERREEADQNSLLTEIKERGTILDMTAQEALVAQVAGWEGREPAWKNSIERALATGDFAGLYDLIKAFNRSTGRSTRKPAPADWEPMDLAAVAN